MPNNITPSSTTVYRQKLIFKNADQTKPLSKSDFDNMKLEDQRLSVGVEETDKFITKYRNDDPTIKLLTKELINIYNDKVSDNAQSDDELDEDEADIDLKLTLSLIKDCASDNTSISSTEVNDDLGTKLDISFTPKSTSNTSKALGPTGKFIIATLLFKLFLVDKYKTQPDFFETPFKDRKPLSDKTIQQEFKTFLMSNIGDNNPQKNVHVKLTNDICVSANLIKRGMLWGSSCNYMVKNTNGKIEVYLKKGISQSSLTSSFFQLNKTSYDKTIFTIPNINSSSASPSSPSSSSSTSTSNSSSSTPSSSSSSTPSSSPSSTPSSSPSSSSSTSTSSSPASTSSSSSSSSSSTPSTSSSSTSSTSPSNQTTDIHTSNTWLLFSPVALIKEYLFTSTKTTPKTEVMINTPVNIKSIKLKFKNFIETQYSSDTKETVSLKGQNCIKWFERLTNLASSDYQYTQKVKDTLEKLDSLLDSSGSSENSAQIYTLLQDFNYFSGEVRKIRDGLNGLKNKSPGIIEDPRFIELVQLINSLNMQPRYLANGIPIGAKLENILNILDNKIDYSYSDQLKNYITFNGPTPEEKLENIMKEVDIIKKLLSVDDLTQTLPDFVNEINKLHTGKVEKFTKNQMETLEKINNSSPHIKTSFKIAFLSLTNTQCKQFLKEISTNPPLDKSDGEITKENEKEKESLSTKLINTDKLRLALIRSGCKPTVFNLFDKSEIETPSHENLMNRISSEIKKLNPTEKRLFDGWSNLDIQEANSEKSPPNSNPLDSEYFFRLKDEIIKSKKLNNKNDAIKLLSYCYVMHLSLLSEIYLLGKEVEAPITDVEYAKKHFNNFVLKIEKLLSAEDTPKSIAVVVFDSNIQSFLNENLTMLNEIKLKLQETGNKNNNSSRKT